jgi:hypothetical protein
VKRNFFEIGYCCLDPDMLSLLFRTGFLSPTLTEGVNPNTEVRRPSLSHLRHPSSNSSRFAGYSPTVLYLGRTLMLPFSTEQLLYHAQGPNLSLSSFDRSKDGDYSFRILRQLLLSLAGKFGNLALQVRHPPPLTP